MKSISLFAITSVMYLPPRIELYIVKRSNDVIPTREEMSISMVIMFRKNTGRRPV